MPPTEKPQINHPDAMPTRQFVYDLFEIALGVMDLPKHAIADFRDQVARQQMIERGVPGVQR